VKVPGMNENLTEAEKEVIAVPSIVTPAAPGASASFRSFSISGDGGRFVPAEIIARLNDIVHVNFTAVDKDYDIVFPSYGMRQAAKKGETKILEFQAVSEGSYTYYCDSCGGAKSPASGKIIVVK
jgi:plastocyanin